MKKKNLIRLQDIAFGTIAISSLFLLVGASGVHAASSAIDEVTITVPASCSLTDTVGSPHTATIETGVYQDDIGETTFKVFCNDNEGFSVYAVGYTNEEYGNTTMKPNTLAVSNAITTGTATSGSTSNWAMKLTAVSGDYAPTLETGFNDYHVIPDTYTKVASYSSNTDATTGSSFKSTYGAFISGTQPADSYKGKVKYTVIHPANAVTPITPVATMQNMSSTTNPEAPNTSTVCTSVPSYVIDNRDDHVYTIQRLKDGRCWMMENLDLGRTDLTTNLTSANTNIATTVTAETFNSWKVVLNTRSYSTSELKTYDAGVFIPLTTLNTTNLLDTDPVTGTPYGTLYNYYAASAGTITGNTNSTNAQYDICPAGWRLPTGDYYNGEFKTLYSQYNSPELMRASIANNGAAFALAGIFNGQGYVGGYWASTRSNDTSMDYLNINDSGVGAYYSYSRDTGLAVRCILNESITTISDLTYLQDFNSLSDTEKRTVLGSMQDNTTYNLIDNRDNHTYAVAKLKDGNIWMTENLDLGGTELTNNLTSENTNFNSTITAETFNSWIKSSATGTYTSPELMPISGTDSASGTPYGSLYNYCAASAGSICSAENTIDAEYDICPAGWRLPTGNTTGEFQALYSLSQYNTNAKMRAPIANGGAAFALANYFISSTATNQGNNGGYWSSTWLSDTSMYAMFLYTSDVDTANRDSRSYGFSIRCVAKKPSHTLTISYDSNISSVKVNHVPVQNNSTINLEEGVTYSIISTPNTGYYSTWSSTSGTVASDFTQNTMFTMGDRDGTLSASSSYATTEIQNISQDNCTTTVSHARDVRDDHVYLIQRLADGKCWMMENLDLGRTELTTDLTSANTNLSTTILASFFNGLKKTSGTATYNSGEFIPVDGMDVTNYTPYGTLYNYCAVSAYTICGSSNYSNATYDICPAGWRLPTGGSSGEFQNLYNQTEYNTSAKMEGPIASGGAAFASPGWFYDSEPSANSSRYWTSTRYNGSIMYSFNASFTNQQYEMHDRRYGLPVRCVAKQ